MADSELETAHQFAENSTRAWAQSRRLGLRLLGAYYCLVGVLASFAWLLHWGLTGSMGPQGGWRIDLPELMRWLPYAFWALFGTACIGVGVGLLRQQAWSRWGGLGVALLFLVDGVISLHERAGNLLSLLVSFAIPIATVSILFAPRRVTPTDEQSTRSEQL